MDLLQGGKGIGLVEAPRGPLAHILVPGALGPRRHSSGLKTFSKPRPAKSLTFAVANSVTP
jgi:hypothetical protein